MQEKVDRYSGGAMRSADPEANRLARADRFNMVEAGWRLTADNYIGRVPKARILEAVRKANGLGAARLIEDHKTPELAKEAEMLLEGYGGFPHPDPVFLPGARWH